MPTKKRVSAAARTSAALLTLASILTTLLAVYPATAKISHGDAGANASADARPAQFAIPKELPDSGRLKRHATRSKRATKPKKSHNKAARFTWPVKKDRITVPFGWRRSFVVEDGKIVVKPGREFHHGIDIACTEKDPVRTSSPGVVLLSGPNLDYGNVVVIAHAGGWSTLYGHLHTRYVYGGQRVGRNQLIGLCGMTGRATGPHVHFEVRKDGRFFDPLRYLP
jgi:murein DD-endopeptidase MepM/ murein hydrolase activator NlpD